MSSSEDDSPSSSSCANGNAGLVAFGVALGFGPGAGTCGGGSCLCGELHEARHHPPDSEETAVEEVGAREVARAGATGASADTGALSRRTGRKRSRRRR